MRTRYVYNLVFLSSFLFSSSLFAASNDCFGTFQKIWSYFFKPSKISLLQKELPEVTEFYSTKVQKAAIKSHDKYVKDWKPARKDQGLAESIQPFLDIEHAVDTISKRQDFNIHDFLKQMNHWQKEPELAPYLYSQIPRFGKYAEPLLELLAKEKKEFKDVFLMEAPMASLVTFSFEKETHKRDAGLWYRPKNITEEDWSKLSPKEQGEKLWGRWGMWKAKRVPTLKKPAYLSDAHFELPMRNMQGWFNLQKPPIEFAHKKYEIQLSEIMRQIREVGKTMGETSQFHLHVVFYHPEGDQEGFDLMSQWWRKVNEYLYFYGIEQGLHPTKLTKLPEKSPKSFRDTTNKLLTKFFGAALRSGFYGPGRPGTYKRVGIELRDVTKNFDDLERIARKVALSAKDRVWQKGMGYEESPLRIEPNDKDSQTAFKNHFKKLGISNEEMDLFLSLEPKLAIPFLPLKEAFTKNLPHENSDVFEQGLETFSNEILGNMTEYRDILSRGEKVHPEDLRTVLRMALSAWAKVVRPSRLYSDF